MQTKFKHLSILYVEDDEVIRQSACKYLEKFCKKVWTAKDGLEALEVYEDYSPDIIMSDIQMPRLNGLDMAKKIRLKDKKTPIILATAFTGTCYLLKAVELQLVKYLVKPITSAKLLEALDLAQQQLTQEKSNIINLGNAYLYDTLNKTLLYDDDIIKLTKNELLLVELLATHAKHTVTYKEIENYIWFDSFMSMDTLRSHMRSLRKKVPNLQIENVSGIGYILYV